MRKKNSKFEANYAMTHPSGCIYSRHVPILCPSENSQDYYYRIFFTKAEVVCDFKDQFMDIDYVNDQANI